MAPRKIIVESFIYRQMRRALSAPPEASGAWQSFCAQSRVNTDRWCASGNCCVGTHLESGTMQSHGRAANERNERT